MTSTATTVPTTFDQGKEGKEDNAGALRWSPRLWGALILLCGVLFLDGLDVSMVGVALPSIRQQLGMSTSALQWVVSGYVLGYGGFLLLGGRAADLLGRRRVLLIALGVFTVASLFGGLVDNPELLIVARFVKGMSAAFTAPAGLSIITTTFPEGPARNRALSIYTACGASGFSSGLILGGLMTEVGWRWTFLLPVPIALVVLVVGTRLIPHGGRSDDRHRGYDILGALLSTSALLVLVFSVVSAPQVGWASPRTIGGLVLAAVLGAGFVITEQRVAHPLLRLGILRNRRVVAANIAAMVMFGSYVSFQFIGTMYMQSLLGWSPLVMALAFLPAGLLVAFGGPRTGALVNRFGSVPVVIAGLISLFAGYALFLRVGIVPHYPTMILPSMLLLGIGFALAFPALNIQATSGVGDDEQGLASGLVQTAFQVGGAITLAVVTAVISASTTGNRPEQVLASYHPGLVLVTCVALAGVLATVALSGLRTRRNEAAVPAVEVAD